MRRAATDFGNGWVGRIAGDFASAPCQRIQAIIQLSAIITSRRKAYEGAAINKGNALKNALKWAAILVFLTLNTRDLAAQTRPNSTEEAHGEGYTEMHGDAALRFIIGNSLQIQAADADHHVKTQHIFDDGDIYGTAEGNGCPRIPRILTRGRSCGTNDYFHPVRCEPYRVFRKRLYTSITPTNGSEIGFFVPGGPKDATTRWSERQPILRGDVTECASSPDPTPQRPSKIPPPGYLEIYGEEAKHLLIGNTQSENRTRKAFIFNDHTVYKNFDDTCLIETRTLNIKEDCSSIIKNKTFCTYFRVFKKINPDAIIGANIGFYVPSHENFTFWFQKGDIFRGNISGCDGKKHAS